MNTVTTYLVRVHHMSNTLPIIKQFIQQMETHLHQRYMAPLSYRDICRTRKELKLSKSIESKLKKENTFFVLPTKVVSFILVMQQTMNKKQKLIDKKLVLILN